MSMMMARFQGCGRIELLLTKIERTESVWGQKGVSGAMLARVQFEMLRCSLDIQWEMISRQSGVQGKSSGNLRFISLQMVVKVRQLNEIMQGISVDRKEERSKDQVLQHFQISEVPKDTEKERSEKSEKKQIRMASWKTEESISGNSTIKCQMLPTDHRRYKG